MPQEGIGSLNHWDGLEHHLMEQAWKVDELMLDKEWVIVGEPLREMGGRQPVTSVE
jgi:hypothetical protein